MENLKHYHKISHRLQIKAGLNLNCITVKQLAKRMTALVIQQPGTEDRKCPTRGRGERGLKEDSESSELGTESANHRVLRRTITRVKMLQEMPKKYGMKYITLKNKRRSHNISASTSRKVYHNPLGWGNYPMKSRSHNQSSKNFYIEKHKARSLRLGKLSYE
jgi:hypothetical protein